MVNSNSTRIIMVKRSHAVRKNKCVCSFRSLSNHFQIKIWVNELVCMYSVFNGVVRESVKGKIENSWKQIPQFITFKLRWEIFFHVELLIWYLRKGYRLIESVYVDLVECSTYQVTTLPVYLIFNENFAPLLYTPIETVQLTLPIYREYYLKGVPTSFIIPYTQSIY